jgi:biopolymer transport protein ExbD
MPDMKEGGVNVTPLIDIVMCLIIFYMLVAKIGVAVGIDQSIKIPESIQGLKIKDFGNTLTLNVRPGPMSAAGPVPQITAEVGGTMTELHITGATDSLVETLRYLRAGDPARNIPENRSFAVIIQGEKSMTFQYLAPVLIACAQANVHNVSFATGIPVVEKKP